MLNEAQNKQQKRQAARKRQKIDTSEQLDGPVQPTLDSSLGTEPAAAGEATSAFGDRRWS